MRERPHHLEALMVRKAHISDAERVRYRVYQSPNEFIVVIAESALMAIRISGVKNPYKIVRDLPTVATAVEKGRITVPENSEHISLPITRPELQALNFIAQENDGVEAFVSMGLEDLYTKRSSTTSVLSREEAIRVFAISETAPTLVPPKPEPKPVAPVIAAAPVEAPAAPKNEALSQEEIARLLGDV